MANIYCRYASLINIQKVITDSKETIRQSVEISQVLAAFWIQGKTSSVDLVDRLFNLSQKMNTTWCYLLTYYQS